MVLGDVDADRCDTAGLAAQARATLQIARIERKLPKKNMRCACAATLQWCEAYWAREKGDVVPENWSSSGATARIACPRAKRTR